MTASFITIPGVTCPCGSEELRVIEPGDDCDRSDLLEVMLRRPVPLRGWCCLDHWQNPPAAKGCERCGTAPLTTADASGLRWCSVACAGVRT